MPTFKDHFSKQSDLYVKYRPLYPKELYAYLSSLTEKHELAWDCGTGNGQATIGLTDFYTKIFATDPSEAQISNAIQHPKIKYKIQKAETTSLAPHSVDLLTIANALHWFDLEMFYKEVSRTLKPGGIIAAWAYRLPHVTSEIDALIEDLHNITLHDYWLAENRLVEQEYKTIPFPFESIQSPDFFYEKEIDLSGLIGYLNTWSATQRYIEKNKVNPITIQEPKLESLWKEAALKKTIRWNLTLKVGRV
jgi:SAM-dependent methyltransferase